jgi:hypothetical protein
VPVGASVVARYAVGSAVTGPSSPVRISGESRSLRFSELLKRANEQNLTRFVVMAC